MRSTRLLGCAVALLFVAGSTATASAQDAGTNGADDSVRSDLKSIATMMETFATDTSHYPTGGDIVYNGKRDLSFGENHHQLAFGDRVGAIKLTENGMSYCLKVDRATTANAATKDWRYVSSHGVGTGPCPDRFVVSSYPTP